MPSSTRKQIVPFRLRALLFLGLTLIAGCVETAMTSTSTDVDEGNVALVTDVVDGDTFHSRVGGSEERVRLIGINAPEADECLGAEARDALGALIDGQSVTLEADVSDRDRFGRLLRYVYLEDGTFVNEEMVSSGLALAVEYPPDTARSDELTGAQMRAKADELGVWAAGACGQPDMASDLHITHIEYDAPGDDNQALNDEWVEIENDSDVTVDLTDWVLRDESSIHRYPFPGGFQLAAGSGVRVHTGCGTDTPTELHWCEDGAVWNNDGDTAFLLDPVGNIVSSHGY